MVIIRLRMTLKCVTVPVCSCVYIYIYKALYVHIDVWQIVKLKEKFSE